MEVVDIYLELKGAVNANFLCCGFRSLIVVKSPQMNVDFSRRTLEKCVIWYEQMVEINTIRAA